MLVSPFRSCPAPFLLLLLPPGLALLPQAELGLVLPLVG